MVKYKVDEYIKRDATLAVIQNLQKSLCPDGVWGRKWVDGADRERYDDLEEILDCIGSIPAVDVTPEQTTQFKDGECLRCGWFGDGVDTPFYQFCPGCGARVVSPRE